MAIVSQVTCRRCGAQFSSMRSRCPECGTRRVAQSSRTPGTTPGTVKGTAAYGRQEANIKWQIAFGMVLIVAVVLAVIVMVSTSLDGLDGSTVRATPTPYVKTEDEQTGMMPEVFEAPTPEPTPEPTVETIRIYNYTNDITDEKNWPMLRATSDAEYKMQLKAMVMPQDIQNPVIEWSVDDPEAFSLKPDETDPNVMIGQVLKAKAGGVKVSATCYGKTATITIYLVEG